MIFETQVVSRKNSRPDAEDWATQEGRNELDAAEKAAARMDAECDIYEGNTKIFVLVRKPQPRSVIRKFQVARKFEAVAL